MTLEYALIFANLALSSIVVGLMAFKGVYRQIPVFFACQCFDLASGIAGVMLYSKVGFCALYFHYVLGVWAIDFVVYFLILRELGKNLLRFNREPRPRAVLAVLLFAGIALPILALTAWSPVPARTPLSNFYYLSIRTDQVVTFAGLLALLLWSNLRGLRWPERELRVATGLAIDAFAWLVVSLLHARWRIGPVYDALDQAGQAADGVTLAYWLHGFWIERPAAEAAALGSRNGRTPDLQDTLRRTFGWIGIPKRLQGVFRA